MCVCVGRGGVETATTQQRKEGITVETSHTEQVKWLHGKGRPTGRGREVEQHIQCQISALLSIVYGPGAQSQDFKSCWLATCQIVQSQSSEERPLIMLQPFCQQHPTTVT